MQVCFKTTWKTQNDKVVCHLCPFLCHLKDGENGVCRVRSNRGGSLVLDNYGQTIVPVLDRIQKRPVYLYNGYPKDDRKINSLSIGSTGCNNRCPFCQNFEISQVSNWDGLRFYSPDFIVNKAIENKVDFISFSFNEVIVIFEYFCDVADIARKKGLKICVKTAGYISKELTDEFLSRVDVLNLDIKPQDNDYLKKCGVLDQDVVFFFIERCLYKNIHIEISHILIEGVNDNKNSINKFINIVQKYANNIIGIHLLRHYPAWKSNYPLTSDASLIKWAGYLKDSGLENVFYDDVG